MNGWTWRRGTVSLQPGTWFVPDVFHAWPPDWDTSMDAACCSDLASCPFGTLDPTEGDAFCPECMAIVRTTPAPL